MKFRLKYMFTFVILAIASYFNWREIPIQPEYATIVKWVFISMASGFGFKKGAEMYKTYKEEKFKNILERRGEDDD